MDNNKNFSVEVYEMSDTINLFKILSKTASSDEQVFIIENIVDDIAVEMQWYEQKYEWMTEDDYMCPVVQVVCVHKGNEIVLKAESEDGGQISAEDINKIVEFIKSLNKH